QQAHAQAEPQGGMVVPAEHAFGSGGYWGSGCLHGVPVEKAVGRRGQQESRRCELLSCARMISIRFEGTVSAAVAAPLARLGKRRIGSDCRTRPAGGQAGVHPLCGRVQSKWTISKLSRPCSSRPTE